MVAVIFYIGLVFHILLTLTFVWISFDEEELHPYLGLAPLGFAGFALLGYFIL